MFEKELICLVRYKHPYLGVVENMSYMQISGKVESTSTDLSDIKLYINEKKISFNNDKSFNYKFHLFKEGGGLSESKRLDVPLLGQIPYSEELMLSIDKGEPLVFSNDKHPISEIFNKIANSLQK